MKPAPATSALETSALLRQRGDDRLRQFARVLARRLGDAHGDVALEVAVLRVARAFDHHLGRIDRLGQNCGNK